MAYIAMIGTRQVDTIDPAIIDTYELLAETASRLGHVVVSGAAKGCDQRAMGIAARNHGKVLAVLPWASYEREWLATIEHECQLTRLIYDDRRFPEWTASVARYHPAPRALTLGARALHARNFGIIENSDAVIAVPSPTGGGTAQGIRIAEDRTMPLFDLNDVTRRRAAWEYLERLGHAG